MKKSIGSKDLIFPAPVLIVGTYSIDGKPNAMNVAWGGICSYPPCIAISIQENRRTHKNILQKKAFTINIPNEKQVEEADFFGLVSGNTYDKFDSVNLTTVKGDKVDAPYIEEFPINIECELMDMIGIGEHTQFIGKILDIKIDDEYEKLMNKSNERMKLLNKNPTKYLNLYPSSYNELELNDKSVLMKLGYNLQKSERERHQILKEKASPLLGKEKCIKFLEFQIRLKENILTKDYSNAISKWQKDIQFIENCYENI